MSVNGRGECFGREGRCVYRGSMETLGHLVPFNLVL